MAKNNSRHKTWRMKMEIPLPTDNFESTQLALRQKGGWLECFADFKIHGIVGQEGLIQNEFDSYQEITFDITEPDDSINICHALFSAVRRFFDGVVEFDVPDYSKAAILLNSMDWFIPKLESAHLDNPVSAIHFGCLQGGKLLSHWEVSYEERRREKTDMQIFFEYDRNTTRIEFFNMENIRITEGDKNQQNGRQRTRRQQQLVYYRLLIQNLMVRRLIVDLGTEREPYKRLHFVLNSPAVVKKCFCKSRDDKESIPKRYTQIRRGRTPQEWSHELALADSPILTVDLDDMQDDRLYHILSRLRARCGVSIEFMHIDIYSVPYSNNSNPYYDGLYYHPDEQGNEQPIIGAGPTYPQDVTFGRFLHDTFGNSEKQKADRESVYYLIEALISRGAIVKDQFLLKPEHWHSFLRAVSRSYALNNTVCIEALERILTRIDEHKRIGSITQCLVTITDALIRTRQRFGLTREQLEEGYQLVRKVVVTPTRVVRIAPEMVMGNRVLRNQKRRDCDDAVEIFSPEDAYANSTEVIRVSFRDDDNNPMRVSNVSAALMDKTITGAFKKGLFIAGRRYFFLGSSSSQMRDQGAHFMLGVTDADRLTWLRDHPDKKQPEDFSIQKTRVNMGRFMKLENVAKIMARLGQCFTQSRESKIGLYREEYQYTYDVTGGNDLNGDPFIFTDGVGSISHQFASSIADEMKLNSVPSCFQFRFRGAKGVLSVDFVLDELLQWADDNNIPPPEKVKDENQGSWGIKCLFRQSQIKFEAKRYYKQPLEVVKFSGPTGVCLNKPFINILDQVSAKQSLACHRRVTNRIEELLDGQLQGLAQILLSEKHCRNKLSELPRRIDIAVLSQRIGFQLVNEPFFRSLLKAAVKFQTTKQLRKEQIQVPFNKGRSMLGITDQTDRLQYGQVFVQYTRNITEYSPPADAAKIVLKGRVLVTKNPSVVGGDVRVFEAVDIPELHDLVDVIAFPKHGPRPHPDEMAGSDLDGDEYSVIWDPDLVLDYSEEAASYQKTTAKKHIVSKDTLNDELCSFFINYVKQDNVGVISNAHLFQSDLYGLNSKVCHDLANKAAQAVDFPKTGIAPERLRTQWEREEAEDDSSDWLPPEKAERYPDFHFNNEYMPIYISNKLIGKLYREIKMVEDVLRMSEESDHHTELELDPHLEYAGWQEYAKQAAFTMENYNGRILNIMETYGIKTEGELFSGCICEMRNRISDKDQDDMSFYNTRHTIEERVNDVFRDFRKDFFEEFGGWEQCTMAEMPTYEHNIFRRTCHCVTEGMRKKASAYYMTCYRRAAETGDRRLSFAWLAFDVLAEIKPTQAVADDTFGQYETPLVKIIEDHSRQYLENYQMRFADFCEKIRSNYVILQYCTRYAELDKAMFIMCEWANCQGLLHRSFAPLHLCLLLILFSVNHFVEASNAFGGVIRTYMQKIDPGVDFDEIRQQATTLDRPYELIISFFGFLASRRFRKLDSLAFSPIGVHSVFLRGEWVDLHKAAVKTYYNLVFSLRFDDLPVEYLPSVKSVHDRELEPFIIELPLKNNAGHDLDLKQVERCLLKVTKVKEVKLRRIPHKPTHVTVVCRGPLSACYKLRSLVAVRLNPHSSPKAKELSDQLAQFTIDTIMRKYNETDHWEVKSDEEEV